MSGLVDGNGRPITSSAEQLGDAELGERMAEEILALMHERKGLVLQLEPLGAIQLAGLLQLAFRHPEIRHTGSIAAAGEDVLETIRQFFASTNCTAVVEIMRRGDDPANDVDVTGRQGVQP